MSPLAEERGVLTRGPAAEAAWGDTSGPDWLRQIRSDAMARFVEMGFPTTHEEDWRFTNVAPIAGTSFGPPRILTSRDVDRVAGHSPMLSMDHTLLVFANGRYTPAASRRDGLPEGVVAGSLARALAHGNGPVSSHLARLARYRDQAFVALNTGLFEDGAYIEIPAGLRLEKPIHLHFISAGGLTPTASHPRLLVVAGPGSQAVVVESHTGAGNGVYLNNLVAEIVAGEDSSLEYVRVQQDREESYHIATTEVRLMRGARFASRAFSFGAALSRFELNVELAEGCECALDGLYLVRGRQHADNRTNLLHARPGASSRELYKGILGGDSHAVFNGRIVVAKGAQKTDARQTNRNLLLSNGATVNAKPQLEIFADDVKCTHGATIGRLDEEALFYLRARGLGAREARRLLTAAFAREITGRVTHAPLRARIEEDLERRLAGGGGEEEL